MQLRSPDLHRATPAWRKIGVSFVIDTLSRAGTETQLLALIRLLDRDRFEPSLVVLDGTSMESQALEPDCPIIRLGVTKILSRSALSASFQLRRFWMKHPPDIVQTYFLDSAYFAVPIAKSLGVRQIMRVRNNIGYWMTRKHRILSRLLQPMIRATLTNSDSGREALLGEGLNATQVVVLENGVDLPPLKPDTPTVTVGCVANLRTVKNIDGLLRAATIIRKQKPDVTFAVAGDGPERARLETQRDSLDLKGCFRFLGSIRDVPGFLATTAIVALPSHSEGMSNALLEAMASAKPVVATDVGANRRVLGGTGIIVKPRDDSALAEGILELLDRDTVALGQLARQRVERFYSRTAMVRHFEDFYCDLLGLPCIHRFAQIDQRLLRDSHDVNIRSVECTDEGEDQCERQCQKMPGH